MKLVPAVKATLVVLGGVAFFASVAIHPLLPVTVLSGVIVVMMWVMLYNDFGGRK